jgi:hypothetical protein
VIAQQQLPLAGPWQRFSGIPFEGKRISLVNDDQQNVDGEGAIGRLQVEGPALIEGLLVQKQSRWELAPTDWHDGCMRFVSNDLARWSESGELELLGRSNQLLKRHGEWIDASPLQSAVEQQPGVKRCQLFAEAEGIVAWLELENPSRKALRQIGNSLQASLADGRLHPQRLLAVAAMPLNTNGKLDLAALQAALTSPERLGAVHWRARQSLQKLEANLDSLDQAQLVSRLQRTNLLWCGGGLPELEASRPAGIGLVGIGFPRPPSHWHAHEAPNLRQIALEQSDLLLQAAGEDLGQNLWIGGFSLPAWLAYAVSQVFEEHGIAVTGLFLLDPVDPFGITYRWAWRRKVARAWREGMGSHFDARVTQQRRQVKSWRQEVLGRWTCDGGLTRIDAPVHLISSNWNGHLRLDRARQLQPDLRWEQLPTQDHAAVTRSPELVDQWVRYVWAAIARAQGINKQETDGSRPRR